MRDDLPPDRPPQDDDEPRNDLDLDNEPIAAQTPDASVPAGYRTPETRPLPAPEGVADEAPEGVSDTPTVPLPRPGRSIASRCVIWWSMTRRPG